MRWNALIGQESAKALLREYLEKDRLPHALLITGKEGWGGLPFSLALSRRLVCRQPQGWEACNQCEDCRMMDRLEHPDIHFSFPVISVKSGQKPLPSQFIAPFRSFVAKSPYGTAYDWLQFLGAENKQGNLSAEACREMIANLALKSWRGKYKVQVIWMAEYLGKEGNILLKLIEEPPEKTLIILIAAQGQKVLETIRSRTQEIRLRPLEAEAIQQHLLEQHSDLSADDAMAVARMAEGDFDQALRLLRESVESGSAMIDALRQWFNAVFLRNGFEIHQFVENWSKKGREQQKHFLTYCIDLMRHGFRRRYLADSTPSLSPRENEFIGRLAKMNMDSESFLEISDAMAQTRYRIERNAHGKTQLHALSIRLQRIIHAASS